MNGKIFNYPVLRGRRQSVSRINRINSGLNVLSSVSPLAVAIFSDNIALPVHFRRSTGALPALYRHRDSLEEPNYRSMTSLNGPL